MKSSTDFAVFTAPPQKKTCPPKFCFMAPKQIFVWRKNTQRFTSSMTAVKRRSAVVVVSSAARRFCRAEAPNSVTEKATSDPIGQSNGLWEGETMATRPVQRPTKRKVDRLGSGVY